jgi:hypothetical protein
MVSVIYNYQSVRSLWAFYRSTAFIYSVLALAGCSGSGDDGGNLNQGGSAVPTNGTAGQSNGTGGAQVVGAAGGKGGLQTGAGGANVTTTGAGGKAVSAATGGKSVTAGTGGKGGTAAAGAGGKPADAGPADVACNPADRTDAPRPVNWTDTDTPPTGPYKVTIEIDPGLPTQTEYRPELKGDIKYPIVAWGEGGCVNNSLIMVQFLYDVASNGFLIVADGTDNATPTPQTASGDMQKAAITWAIKENERPCSQYYHKLDTTKVAAMGQSCGGLMTYYAAGDPRLTTIVIWNSGLFAVDQAVYDSLHLPMAYFLGGTTDIAYANGDRDYNNISPTAKFPIFYGNLDVGHNGTYNQDNGGEFARVGEAWLRWQLMGDQGATGKEMFVGKNCGLCNTDWVIKKTNME